MLGIILGLIVTNFKTILLFFFFIISKFVKLFDISKTISCNSLGRIYKPAFTLKDSLENHLKKEEYVEGIVENNKTYYKITSKSKQLLKGWISFLNAYKYN